MACPGPEIKMSLVLEVYVASLVAMTSRCAIIANLDLRVLAGDPVVAERELEIEVFPVGFLAGGNEIWLAWESVESRDRFLQDERGFLPAESLAEISRMIMNAYDGVSVEGETFYDMDSCLIALREGCAKNPELLVEVWNILSGLSSTILGERRKFHPGHADSYDAFFSQCEVAGFVGMAPEPISPMNGT